MRNLKRVLSLALALVMMLGMMVIGANAAGTDFADADEINYTEAVDVMSALGVLEGDGTNYNPADILTRDQAAKIVCFMLMGPDNAKKLVGSNVYTDVPAKHWAAGYISYCDSLGILAGNGDGTFSPAGQLTGVAFAKMLLIALGYDPAVEGYVENKNWATNIGTDAIDAGLNIKGVDLSAPVTREQAAQMALNTLTATMVKYTNKGTNITLSDGTKVVVGASPASTKTWADAPGATPVDYTQRGATAPTSSIQFCENYFSTLAQAGGTVNGRAGYTWTVKGEEVSDFVISDVVLKTVNSKGVALANLTDKTNKDYVGVQMDNGTPATTYYINGTAETTAATYNAAITTKGAVIELIDTDRDGLCDKVCVVKKTVTTLTADPTVSTTGGKTYVTIPACGVASKLAAKVVGYEGLKRNDVVLYVTMADGTTVIEKAESFNGFVLGYNGGTGKGDLIGDKYYAATGLTVSGTNTYSVNTIKDATAEYTFYLDNAGYIAKAVPVSAQVATNYAVVRDIVWVKPTTDGSIGSVSKSYAQAKLVFTDGSSEIVKIASIDGIKLVAAGTQIKGLVSGATHYTGAQAAAAGLTAANSTTPVPTGATPMTADKYYGFSKSSAGALVAKYYAVTDDVNTGKTNLQTLIPLNSFYSYTVNTDGTYALSTTMKLGETRDRLAKVAITNGKVAFDGTNVADDNTVFIYATKNAAQQDVYTVYTGIKNAPTTATFASNNVTDESTAYSIVEKSGTGVATYVFAVVSGTQTDSKDIVYITSTNYTAVNAKTPYYIYDAVVNGVVTTVKADTSGLGVDFYKVDKVVDGIYTLNSTIANSADKTGVQSISGGILVTGDETAYTYTSGAPAYVIEKVGTTFTCTATTIDALTLDATDALFVLTKTVGVNTNAETVYVVKANEAPSALVLGQGTATVTSIGSSGNLLGTTTVAVAAGGTGKQVAITTATAATDTTIKGMSINGTAVAVNDDYTLTANGTYTVVVTVEDDFSKALTAYTYTFTVTGVV